MNSIEKIISDSKWDGYKRKAALRELSERQPTHLSDADRATATELVGSFKASKAEWVEFESRLNRFQQDFAANQTELPRLKATLDPDDTDGINRLTFLSARQQALSHFIGRATARQNQMLNTAENNFCRLDAILTNNFGKPKIFGMSVFLSCAFGELPLRLDLALAELGELLKQP